MGTRKIYGKCAGSQLPVFYQKIYGIFSSDTLDFTYKHLLMSDIFH